MQEMTIKETQIIVGGSSFTDGLANGFLLSTGPFGYLIGLGLTGQADPTKWGKLC